MAQAVETCAESGRRLVRNVPVRRVNVSLRGEIGTELIGELS